METSTDKPQMSVIAGRPIKVQNKLASLDGVLVQCRLPTGEDVHVPARELMQQFEKDLVARGMQQAGKDVLHGRN